MESQDLQGERLTLDVAPRWAAIAAVIGLCGLGLAALLAVTTDGGAETFFRSYLVNFMFVLSLALGGLFFVLISHLTRAGWSVALRRIAEVVAWTVVPLSLLSVVLLFGIHELYEWSHEEAVADDALLQHKRPYLNQPFFIARICFYFIVWSAIAIYVNRKSVQQDASGDPQITLQLEKFSAPATIFYAMTVTFAAFDLMMSLYPHWYSTIYGVYYFSGCVLGFFALVPVLLALLRAGGRMQRIVTAEHYHDLGKLMFAFVVFWAYIAFSQYMLIWYGNIPEETIWYETRQQGPWLWIGLLLLFGHFILPFLWLMSRHPKRRGAVLLAAALWLLAMHWFDLFYLVMPEVRPTGSPFRLMDLACLVGLVGLFFAATFWRMGRVKLIPVKDPRLGESLRFENA